MKLKESFSLITIKLVHNIRVVNQDLAKQDVLSKLNGNNCLIVSLVLVQGLMMKLKESFSLITMKLVHNIRVVNQDLAKQDVLSKLNGNNCLIVMDWAMKFLPLR